MSDLAAFLAEDFGRIEPLAPDLDALAGRRLFLSGATGFFGKNLLALLDFLHRRGLRFEVVGLSRNPERFLAEQPWAAGLPWLQLLAGDARQPWPGDGPFDLLLHAATDTHAGAHVDAQAVFDDALAGTRRALDFAADHGVQRLLLTGSGAQYGSMPPEPGGVMEDAPGACDPTQASSAYGEAKRVSELLATLHAQRQGSVAVLTRCFAFVGPGLDLNGHFAIGNFVRDALAGGPLRLNSAGQAVRSYLYGADLAWWLLHLLVNAPRTVAVNVGSDQALTVAELALLARDQLCPGGDVHLGPPQPDDARRHYLPNIERARSLGLRDWTALPLAIQRTADWHRLHA
ncbi:NAD-dependent epimerase/dehydratase family protein [Roseateles sp. NT4]|uniref:NAD-dependent epimerase/dehydratase family protein n=1 Tax=Roseateles sp. NT4 TaxID=3453715 RepID=UPI003EEFBD0A